MVCIQEATVARVWPSKVKEKVLDLHAPILIVFVLDTAARRPTGENVFAASRRTRGENGTSCGRKHCSNVKGIVEPGEAALTVKQDVIIQGITKASGDVPVKAAMVPEKESSCLKGSNQGSN